MNEEGQEPYEYCEDQILGIMFRVLRPDDNRMETDKGLYYRQDHKKSRQDFQIFFLAGGRELENSEEDGSAVETTSNSMKKEDNCKADHG